MRVSSLGARALNEQQGRAMNTSDVTEKVGYEQFSQEWLIEIEEGATSSLDRGRWFAVKLVTQWLGLPRTMKIL